jgi:hypothetical protein
MSKNIHTLTHARTHGTLQDLLPVALFSLDAPENNETTINPQSGFPDKQI